jgi:hypothetical protein
VQTKFSVFSAATDVVTTMLPLRCARIGGTTHFSETKTDVRLLAMWSSV